LLGLCRQQPFQLGQLLGFRLLEVQGRRQAVVGVHQVDVGRVHDGDAAIALGELVVVSVPTLGSLGDLGFAAGQPDDARIE
jgi:hypothetical protein